MKTNIIFTCCYEPSEDYTDEYVYRLRDGIKKHCTLPHRFVCYTKEQLKGIETERPLFNVLGWWNQVNVFDPYNFGQCIYFDLDTVILGNIDWITSKTDGFWALPRPSNGKIATGVMKYNNLHSETVRRRFKEMRDSLEKDGCFKPPIKGERKSVALKFFGRVFGSEWQRLPVGFGEEIVIYKRHYRGKEGRGNPSIVCFSCQPRPHKVNWLENDCTIKNS